MTPDTIASIEAIGRINTTMIVVLLPVAMYMYARMLVDKRPDIVIASLGLFMADTTNEIVNKIICRVSDYAPLWGLPKNAGWHLMEGWSYEIAFMFLVVGIPFCLTSDMLPRLNNGKKILGLYLSQWILCGIGSIIAIYVEHHLNLNGILTWDYIWWGTGSLTGIALLFVFGYLWFLYTCFLLLNISAVNQKKGLTILTCHFGLNLILFFFCMAQGWL